MNFVKMEGTGNDYVYVDGFREPIPEHLPELARAISHRHFGVGSDGLILVRPALGYDGEMVMFNADGSSSEMCGNGLRCVAKLIHDRGYAKNQELRLLTGAGERLAKIIPGSDGLAEKVQINMGAPVLEGLKIPTTWDLPQVIFQRVDVLDRSFMVTCLSMGNPHCVVYVDDVHNFPVERYGSILETSAYFPRRVNVEFVEVISPNELIQRTWERGAGETWACGTGASAVCVAGLLTGKSSSKVTIHLLGGDLQLEWAGVGRGVMMTGPAKTVFEGFYPW